MPAAERGRAPAGGDPGAARATRVRARADLGGSAGRDRRARPRVRAHPLVAALVARDGAHRGDADGGAPGRARRAAASWARQRRDQPAIRTGSRHSRRRRARGSPRCRPRAACCCTARVLADGRVADYHDRRADRMELPSGGAAGPRPRGDDGGRRRAAGAPCAARRAGARPLRRLPHRDRPCMRWRSPRACCRSSRTRRARNGADAGHGGVARDRRAVARRARRAALLLRRGDARRRRRRRAARDRRRARRRPGACPAANAVPLARSATPVRAAAATSSRSSQGDDMRVQGNRDRVNDERRVARPGEENDHVHHLRLRQRRDQDRRRPVAATSTSTPRGRTTTRTPTA